ncbi:MAG TPA: SAM-dependent methyltransferase [Flavobacteriaceae bacterium]|nr:SAM-dependent methyltransferase [Flavobacteriaceae bacterium]
MRKNGVLYLIPTTLGESNPEDVLPVLVKKHIEHLRFYIAENEKTARRFIKKISPETKQATLQFSVLNKYTQAEEKNKFLNPCLSGEDIGLLSEAGCPAVADPGASIVKLAHEKDIKVVPLVGPSSIILALMSSGLNGQNFAFNGYLPIDRVNKKKELKRLEKLSFQFNQAQLFIETPYRNNQLMEDICASLHDSTSVCVACDLTLPSEFIKTKPVSYWKKNSVDLHKKPTLFIIQKF